MANYNILLYICIVSENILKPEKLNNIFDITFFFFCLLFFFLSFCLLNREMIDCILGDHILTYNKSLQCCSFQFFYAVYTIWRAGYVLKKMFWRVKHEALKKINKQGRNIKMSVKHLQYFITTVGGFLFIFVCLFYVLLKYNIVSCLS